MKPFKSEQSGRSMIEMLAVLAIIGILSVAGIAGYSKAMGKYKEQKVVEQLSTIITNTRNLYAGQGNYNGISTNFAMKANIITADMIVNGVPTHAMGGRIVLGIASSAYGVSPNAGFELAIFDINKETCIFLATTDWGVGASGLLGTVLGDNSSVWTMHLQGDLPLSITKANEECSFYCVEYDPSCYFAIGLV